MLEYEERARSRGYKNIAGVDEAGRGPLAGPVVAAACIIEPNATIEGVDDSKKLTPKMREKLYTQIHAHPGFHIGVGIVEAEVIDEINILQATFEAMRLAVEHLDIRPEFVLVDGNQDPKIGIESECVIKGDSHSMSIAAASIVAKYQRDQIMLSLDKECPEYGFAGHMGYPTKKHIEAITLHGPSRFHRMTFKSLAPFRGDGARAAHNQ